MIDRPGQSGATGAASLGAASSLDVVILGGGPAGSATALALRRRGIKRVLLIEAGHHDRPRIGESVPPDIRRPLTEDLDLWRAFIGEGHDPCYGSRSSWGSDEIGFNDFVFNPHGHGWHLDRQRFDRFLIDQARQRGVTVVLGCRFTAARRQPGGWQLTLAPTAEGEPPGPVAAPMVVEARIVVDATGPAGHFARRQGARPQMLDRLVFITGFLDLPPAGPLSRQTLLEAVENGWWYAARLPGQRCVVAFAADPATIRAERLMTPAGWLAQLHQTRHLLPALDGARLDTPSLQAAVAVSFLRQQISGADWLAVGDAASGYDPLSSQGIHKALVDGSEAAEVIAEALTEGQPISPRYQQAVNQRFADYLAQRNYFYAQEQRWPNAPFWHHRRTRDRLEPLAEEPASGRKRA